MRDQQDKRFAAGDKVMYAAQGVCQVAGIETKDFGGRQVEYYVLKPLYAPNSTVYVPTGNPELTGKLRRLLPAQEILALIRSMPREPCDWIADDAARKEAFRQILAHGSHQELIRAVKAVYRHQQELQQKGRKLHMADERFFKEAEKILYDEFASVLGLQPEQVLPFILDQLEGTGQEPPAGGIPG